MSRAAPSWLPISRALIEEFYARNWRSLCFALVSPLLFLVPILALSRRADPDQSLGSTEVGVMLHFALFWATVGACGSALLPQIADPRQRYAMPASSLLLVAVPMVCAMLTVFLQYALLATFLNLLFNTGWTVLAPGLLAAVLMGLCLTVLWSTSNSQTLQGVTCLAVGIAVVFAIQMWGAPHDTEPSWLFQLSGPFLGLIALTVPLCVAIGTLGFNRLRHGAGLELKRLLDAIVNYSPFRARTAPGRYASATSAQFWLEWTERGALLPLGMAALCVVFLAVAWFDNSNDGALLGIITVLWFMPLPMIGLLFGHRPPKGELGSFAGSRPLSDPQIANSVLKSATFSLVVACGIWAACMALVLLIDWNSLDSSKPYQRAVELGPVGMTVRFALAALTVWSLTCLMTSLALASNGVLGRAMLIGIGMLMVGIALSKCVPVAHSSQVTYIYWLLCAIYCLWRGAKVFVQSWRMRFVPARRQAASMAMVPGGLLLAYLAGMMNEPRVLPFLLIGCLLLPLPLAAASLAVWLNRHR